MGIVLNENIDLTGSLENDMNYTYLLENFSLYIKHKYRY